MAGQVILNSGVYNILSYCKNTFKYICFGNGTWATDEEIPLDTNALKNEFYRMPVTTIDYEGTGNVITFYTLLNGSLTEFKENSITEIGICNLATKPAAGTEATSGQAMLTLQTFSAIQLEENQTKFVKVVVTIQPNTEINVTSNVT